MSNDQPYNAPRALTSRNNSYRDGNIGEKSAVYPLRTLAAEQIWTLILWEVTVNPRMPTQLAQATATTTTQDKGEDTESFFPTKLRHNWARSKESLYCLIHWWTFYKLTVWFRGTALLARHCGAAVNDTKQTVFHRRKRARRVHQSQEWGRTFLLWLPGILSNISNHAIITLYS